VKTKKHYVLEITTIAKNKLHNLIQKNFVKINKLYNLKVTYSQDYLAFKV
jgi:hypothetical protein